MSSEFGVFVSPERPSFDLILHEVQLSESLGYHSIWMSDHVFGLVGDPANSTYECWTTLAALAALTTRIKLGQLVLCNPFRNPALLGKMGATLDNISNGRLILGLGTGWNEPEFKSYGYPYEKPSTRVRRVAEAAQIIRKLWTEERPTFKGRHYTLNEAYCYPKPVQKPHPPIMIGGSGENFTLKMVAKYADMSNFATWMGTQAAFKHKVDVMENYCRKYGRDPNAITKTFAVYVLISTNEKEAESKLKYFRNTMADRWGNRATGIEAPLTGTPEQVIERIHSYNEAGVDMFIVRFMGGDFKGEAELFAEKVLPSFA